MQPSFRFATARTAASAVVMLLTIAPGNTAAADTVTIDSIRIASNQLTIDGDLGTGPVRVLFGSTELPIVSAFPTRIVARLNPLPAVGTYRVALTVGNKSASAYAIVADKILAGTVNPNGSFPQGSPFTVIHTYAGNYTVTFPPGTFQVGSPYVWPVLSVRPFFGVVAANVTGYVIGGDQSGSFVVDFGGVDTLFSFTLIQTY